jgi:conjugative transfer signal peptidase TraF
MTPRELRRFYAWTFATTAAAAFAACLVASHLIYNGTSSMPLGLYWLARVPSHDLHRDDIVAFQIPPNVQRLVRARNYLPDSALLLKPIVAAEGDLVCTEGGILRVNGTVLGEVLREDTSGRPLPQETWCGPVPEDAVFVASPHPRSFDSRTFGLVPVNAILGKVTSLWT